MALTKESLLIEKCLSLTAFIETSKKHPEFYSQLSGNFDGQGISYGPLQWCLGQGSLQPLLKEVAQKYPNIFDNAFGLSAPAVKDMLNKIDIKSQVLWSAAIQRNNKILDDWKKKFYDLGQTKEMQQIQLSAVKSVFNKSVAMLSIYGVKSQRAVALFFDIRVQNGSISEEVKLDILNTFTKQNVIDEVEKLKIIAIKRAEAANPKWQADVKARKLCIAAGSGVVHGSQINLERDFFITMQNAS